VDPFDPSTLPRATFPHNGLTWHYLDFRPRGFDAAKPDATPTVICMHGFPDHSYGYRHFAPHMTRRGYRVLVPDFPGFVVNADISTRRRYYSTKARCDGAAALLDWAGVKRAYVVGHDWGAFTAWRFVLYYPERCFAVAPICAAYEPPREEHQSLEEAQKITSRLNYQLYFCRDDAEAEIAANLELFLRSMF
ncbi:Alpha/Beta hydrolase protein, partial [Hyaloraphidium curvatum]